jgi:hypothetical protein
MKKIIAIMAMVAATSAFAGTAALEYQNLNTLNGGNNQASVSLSIKENITPTLAGDVGISNTETAATRTLSTRIEGGLTYARPVGPVGVYVRGAVGEKYTGATDYQYYSIEPGVTYFMNDKLSFKVGYRYRTAVDEAIVDATNTVRVGATYALTKNDAINVRFDRVRGYTEQDGASIAYVRSF